MNLPSWMTSGVRSDVAVALTHPRGPRVRCGPPTSVVCFAPVCTGRPRRPSTSACGSQPVSTLRAPSGGGSTTRPSPGVWPMGGFLLLQVARGRYVQRASLAVRAALTLRSLLCPTPRCRSEVRVGAGREVPAVRSPCGGCLLPERSRGPVAGVGPPVRRWRAGLATGGCCHLTDCAKRRVRTVPAPARRRRAGPEGPGDASASAVSTPPVAGPRGACGRARVSPGRQGRPPRRSRVRHRHRCRQPPSHDLLAVSPSTGWSGLPGSGPHRTASSAAASAHRVGPANFAGLPRRGRSFIQHPRERLPR